MLKFIAGLALILCLGAAPVVAQSDADTNTAIDNALMDHAPYRVAFDAIQKAVADGDKAAFAADSAKAAFASWVGYPITVNADGKKITIKDARQFVEHYDAILTDEIKNAITSQKWRDLFTNYQGVMFGNGQLWLNGICKDETCAQFDVKIITIQSTTP